jgi:hypothetical protein
MECFRSLPEFASIQSQIQQERDEALATLRDALGAEHASVSLYSTAGRYLMEAPVVYPDSANRLRVHFGIAYAAMLPQSLRYDRARGRLSVADREWNYGLENFEVEAVVERLSFPSISVRRSVQVPSRPSGRRGSARPWIATRLFQVDALEQEVRGQMERQCSR